MNFLKIISDKLLAGERDTTHSLQMADEFLSPNFQGQKYLLGRNEHAIALAKKCDVRAFVDDFYDKSTWHGVPVKKISELPSGSFIVNCSMSIYPVTTWNRLCSLATMKVANYADLLKFADDVVPMPDFVEKTRADFAEYGNRWCDLFNRLADAESKKVLEDVLCFRLSADPRYMVEYHVRFSDQYFEDFLHLDKEIFVDAGGFNGDTTEEFCRRYPTYKKVILFEPSQKNMCDAKQRLAKYRDIEFHQLGLSSAGGVLQFNQDAGSASAVSEAGLEQIIVSTLDSAYVDSVTFIKMDLEGWELQALSGARKHILCDHPILAISVYHNASDFWSVPNFILGLRDDYDLFLRHYSEGWSESVMFFVPRKSSI